MLTILDDSLPSIQTFMHNLGVKIKIVQILQVLTVDHN